MDFQKMHDISEQLLSSEHLGVLGGCDTDMFVYTKIVAMVRNKFRN